MPLKHRTIPPAEAERLYSIAELAALWGVSRDAIERLLRRHELPYVRVGARRRIRASDAEAYLAVAREAPEWPGLEEHLPRR
jgi:excisionase family DNA binding protein